MTTKNEIVNMIFNTIDEINEQNGTDIAKDINTELFGTQSDLDSLGLVHLITTIEEKIEESTGRYVPIADERAMSLEHSPFKTVDTLANYIETVING